MANDGFVKHEELEALRKMLHEMDKRQAVLENDFRKFDMAFQSIMVKLEVLPDKIGQRMKEEIDNHRTSCKLESAAEGAAKDGGDKTFMQWVIKNQIQIMLGIIILIAAYFGVKLP
jgi:predicted nuclease with TOPRIM domain